MLYRWSSRALENFTSGSVIVAAASADEAREIAMIYLEKTYLPSYGDISSPSMDGRELLVVHCDEEDKDSFIRNFTNDIAAEPEIVSSGCVFIVGDQ